MRAVLLGAAGSLADLADVGGRPEVRFGRRPGKEGVLPQAPMPPADAYREPSVRCALYRTCFLKLSSCVSPEVDVVGVQTPLRHRKRVLKKKRDYTKRHFWSPIFRFHAYCHMGVAVGVRDALFDA